MSNPLRSLDRITIPTPCDADWDSMAGNDQVRFCEHCNLHVNNLSSMTRVDAMRLVARSRGRLCVRYIQRPDGGVLATGVPEKLYRISRRVSRIAAGAFTATLSLTTTAAQSGSGQQQNALRQTPAVATATSQEPGAILSGVITDPNGAVVSGATLTMTNTKTNLAFTYTTGDDGAYKFSLLESGPYSLVVEAPGFEKKEVPGLDLRAGSNETENLLLQIPELTVRVEINAEPIAVVQRVTGGAIAIRRPEDPLVNAASKDDLDLVRQLVLTSPDVNVSDKATDQTALSYAIENGNREMVRTLLGAGADINARSRDGQTAIMSLNRTANLDLVRDLLAAGADVNVRDRRGETPLLSAATSSSFAVIQELISYGAGMDAKNNEGTTVLMRAAENSDPQVAKLLLKFGVDVNARDENQETALLIAARWGSAATAKALIGARADVNAKDGEGRTALILAAKDEDPQLARLLIDAGADVNAKDEDETTPLINAADNDRVQIIKALIEAGAKIDARNGDGQTALMRASEPETVLLLLNAGADFTLKDKEGQTALSLARKSEHEDVIKLLKSRGAPE
jgi:ankyrin repeat protein